MKAEKDKSNSRVMWIDYAKAIAIFLVVLGHTPLCPHAIKQWLYSFHMPVFFSLYGLTWKKERHIVITKEFVIKKVKRLLIPCFVWGIIYTLASENASVKKIGYIIYGSQSAFKKADSLSSLWFLPCMFVATCLFEWIMPKIERLDKKEIRVIKKILMLIVIFLLACIFDTTRTPKVGCPWSLNIALMACFFICIGYLLQGTVVGVGNIKTLYKIITWIAGGVITTLFCELNLTYLKINNVDMASGNYGFPLLFLFAAVGGIILVLISAQLLEFFGRWKVLSFIGKNTFPIFILHKPLVQKICLYLHFNGILGAIFSLVVTIIAILITSVIACVLNKYLPWIVGVDKKQ